MRCLNSCHTTIDEQPTDLCCKQVVVTHQLGKLEQVKLEGACNGLVVTLHDA